MHIGIYTHMSVFGQVCVHACMYVRKGKVPLKTGHEGPQAEWRNSSVLSLNSALDAVGSRRHAEAASLP
jgi:hypothetical protein